MQRTTRSDVLILVFPLLQYARSLVLTLKSLPCELSKQTTSCVRRSAAGRGHVHAAVRAGGGLALRSGRAARGQRPEARSRAHDMRCSMSVSAGCSAAVTSVGSVLCAPDAAQDENHVSLTRHDVCHVTSCGGCSILTALIPRVCDVQERRPDLHGGRALQRRRVLVQAGAVRWRHAEHGARGRHGRRGSSVVYPLHRFR